MGHPDIASTAVLPQGRPREPGLRIRPRGRRRRQAPPGLSAERSVDRAVRSSRPAQERTEPAKSALAEPYPPPVTSFREVPAYQTGWSLHAPQRAAPRAGGATPFRLGRAHDGTARHVAPVRGLAARLRSGMRIARGATSLPRHGGRGLAVRLVLEDVREGRLGIPHVDRRELARGGSRRAVGLLHELLVEVRLGRGRAAGLRCGAVELLPDGWRRRRRRRRRVLPIGGQRGRGRGKQRQRDHSTYERVAHRVAYLPPSIDWIFLSVSRFFWRPLTCC